MPDIVNNENAAWLGFENKVCVITGGGSGIGAETARRMASMGASVAVLDLNQDAAASVAQEIVAAGGKAIGIGADVSSPQAIQAAATEVKLKLGLCDVLVNNAGVQFRAPLMDADLEQWNRTLMVNLTGPLICVQAFAKHMIESQRGGSIVNVGSICGTRPRPNGGAYSASKAGIDMLSKQLMLELAEYNIRSNLVAPGLIRTPLSEKSYQDPEVANKRKSMIPSDRIGATQDVANMIIFLASDRASYVNGQTILVDGGLSETIMSLLHRPAPR